MANSIDLQKIIVPAIAGLDVNFFMKGLGKTDLSAKYTDEGGETINVKVHNASAVYQTNDLTGKLSNMETKTIPVNALPYMTGFAYSDLEDTFELADKDIFLDNAGKVVAEQYNDVAVKEMLFSANQGEVVSTAGTGADFGTLSRAMIRVNNAKLAGNLMGVLSSDLRGVILETAKTNQAFSDSKLAGKYASGNIQSWNGANIADHTMSMVSISDIFAAGTFTVTNVSGIYGGTVAQYTPTASIGTALTIKAGTMFELANVFAVDRRGLALPTKRKFIVKADVTVPTGTGGAVVNIGEVFFTGALKNVSVAAISAVALTNSVEAGANYYVGFIAKDSELIMAQPTLKQMKGANSMSATSNSGASLRVSYDFDPIKSTEVVVLKGMLGVRAYTGGSIYTLYQKV